jgi:hypothetical protein
MNTNQQFNLTLTLAIDSDQNFSLDQLDLATRNLREELYDLGVDSAEFISGGEAPAGAKTADPVTIGALAVAVLPTFLPRLVEYLQSWCLRGENRKIRIKTQVGDRSVEVEYSPSAISHEELTQLVSQLTDSLQSDTDLPQS